ncbi:MAG: methyltransferase domain-containing protein [Desulfobacteraceae bacterium]|nr:methyltransferase domain-containing protein [Desulfobacteraceae bacterium]
MKQTQWDKGSLLQLSGAYWQAFTVHTGVKLDLFTLLDEKPLSVDQVASRAKSDIRGMKMLLNALSAIGLLRSKEDCYHCSTEAKRYLSKNSADYIGYMILHHHHLAPSWAMLDQAVKTGEPVRDRTAVNEDTWREAFLMGMHTSARLHAPGIVERLDLSNNKRFLDMGGGPGTYAVHFCRKFKNLSAIVFDLATTRPFAEKIISQYNLSDRISFLPGNFLMDDIGGPYDTVWMSHILHAESSVNCQMLIKKAADAIEPGGILIIHEFILNDSMDEPLFPALFSLNMLLGTTAGQSYCEKHLCGMLEKAGISKITRDTYCGPNQSGILWGVKS